MLNLPVIFIKYCYKLFIQRQMAVTHIFYFMLCQSSFLSTVISFVYKDKLWFDESMSVWPSFHMIVDDRYDR